MKNVSTLGEISTYINKTDAQFQLCNPSPQRKHSKAANSDYLNPRKM